MDQIRYCRYCRYWRPIPPWQGNCALRPSRKPRWSQSANPGDCPAYFPRPAHAIVTPNESPS